MQDHRDDHHKSYRGNMALATCNHRTDDRHNTDHRQGWQIRLNPFNGFGEAVVDDQAQPYRDHHDLQNAE
ncbi:hypothetical protein D3C80_1289620 [compost metagenome]